MKRRDLPEYKRSANGAASTEDYYPQGKKPRKFPWYFLVLLTSLARFIGGRGNADKPQD